MTPPKRDIVDWIAGNHLVNGVLSRRQAMRRLALVGLAAPTASAATTTSISSADSGGTPSSIPLGGTDGPSGTLMEVKTAGYTAAAGEIRCCDASRGGFTVMLPEAPGDGARIVLKKIDATPNAILLQRSGTDVFNQPSGQSSIQLAMPSQTVILRYQSGIWYVESNSYPPASLDAKYTPLYVRELMDAHGATALAVTPTAEAFNYLHLDLSATEGPTLNAAGTGTSLDLFLGGKNQGVVRILTDGTGTATIGTSSGNVLAQPNQNLNLRSQGSGVVQVNSIEVATTAGAQIIRDKRIEPRVVSKDTVSSLTPLLVAGDIFEITQLRQSLSVYGSLGTTFSGQELLFRIKDNNTSQIINWSEVYRPIGVTMPTSTVAGKWLYVRCIYNSTDAKWDVIDVRQEA